MKRVFLFGLAVLIALAFASNGIAQDKAKAPAKAAPAADKPAAAPEKAVAPAPETATAEKAPASVKGKKEKAKVKKTKTKAKAKAKAKSRAGFVGTVTNYDPASKIAMVKGKSTTVGFDLANAKVKGYGSTDEVKAGDKVVLRYQQDGITVEKIGAKKAKQMKAKKAVKSGKKAKAKKKAVK